MKMSSTSVLSSSTCGVVSYGIPRCAAAVVVMAIFGCSDRPSRVAVPDYDPDQVATQAVKLFDKDGNGSLSADEWGASKSLESAISRVDSDGDKNLTRDEIAKRIQYYVEFRVGLAPVLCTIVQGGRPVAGAKVTYEPEAFMDEAAVPGEGVTDETGRTRISVAEEHLPSPAHAGVRPGFYRVRVTRSNGAEVTKLDAGVECAGDVMNTHVFTLP